MQEFIFVNEAVQEMSKNEIASFYNITNGKRNISDLGVILGYLKLGREVNIRPATKEELNSLWSEFEKGNPK